MTALTLSPAEVALLQQGEPCWVQVPTVRLLNPTPAGVRARREDIAPTPDPTIMAAVEPCEFCDGSGVADEGGDINPAVPCDCGGNGRKRIEVRTWMLVESATETADVWRDVLVGTVSVAEVLPVVGPHFQRTEVRRYVQVKNRVAWLMSRFDKRTAGLGVELDLAHLGDPAALVGSWLACLTDREAT